MRLLRALVRPILLAAALLAGGALPAAADPASAKWTGTLNGRAVHVPEGWTARVHQGERSRWVEMTCETEACAATQESCTLTVVDSPVPRTLVPAAWLVKFSIGTDIAEELTRGAREGTDVTREPHSFWTGQQSWYGGETLAPFGWKSRFQATSVVAGRFVKADCLTCERSDARFDFARSLLAKVRSAR